MLPTIATGAAVGLIAGATAGLVGKRRRILVLAPAGALIGVAIGALAATEPAEVQAVTTPQQFQQQVIESSAPVLVDFHADWCGACKQLAPTIASLADEYAGRARVVKIDVDQSRDLARRYQVQGVPTVILFVDGQETERWVGVRAADEYRRSLDAAVHRHQTPVRIPGAPT